MIFQRQIYVDKMQNQEKGKVQQVSKYINK